MTTLDRAFALAQVNEVTVTVSEYLELHVARRHDIALEEHAIVVEAAHRFASRVRQCVVELRLAVNDAHTPSAATGSSLDDERKADGARVTRVFT